MREEASTAARARCLRQQCYAIRHARARVIQYSVRIVRAQARRALRCCRSVVAGVGFARKGSAVREEVRHDAGCCRQGGDASASKMALSRGSGARRGRDAPPCRLPATKMKMPVLSNAVQPSRRRAGARAVRQPAESGGVAYKRCARRASPIRYRWCYASICATQVRRGEQRRERRKVSKSEDNAAEKHTRYCYARQASDTRGCRR